jgi:hypothetical protein
MRGSMSRRPMRVMYADQDADDERGFEALAEADQEGGEHGDLETLVAGRKTKG